ncbi:phage gp6-like head-tail connector protein [Hymenobacter aerilatus]|uniref:Phage gp6-like head-tail connector protein n=1 Tax=Hymenobacter aerilatus TaxID=2932251 RepID=A0A8T9SZ70_9BACT|nr:head-tail connector protein [Hymenobacter aerilatus]UOR07165.1 phage gp6-like head-tail connector protein [Hymenobacter aerilatus]
MPTTVPIYSPAPLVEPVGLSDLKAWVRVDGESENGILAICLQGAREKVEAYTGRFFAGGQRVEITYELGEPYELPQGATVVSVRGFFTTLEALENWNLEEYRKGISINRELPLNGAYGAFAQTYTVTVDLPTDAAERCPAVVKTAILELAAEWYRNRETTQVGSVASELPVSYRVKLAELRLTNVLF